MLLLSHVIKALTGRVPDLANDFSIEEGCIDSREASKGSLFIALPGEKTDGHGYVDAAFANGAVLALIDHAIDSNYPVIDLQNLPDELPSHPPFSLLTNDSLQALQQLAAWWRDQFDLKVIGITGSVGKSSTKDLMASILSRRLITLKSEGNRNNEIGLPLTLLKLNKNHEVAVLEMGFYVPGEIKLLCNIAKPSIGVITNVSAVHAERAGTLEVITQGKCELVQALPKVPEGYAILNYDDERVRSMNEKTVARVFYYGLSPKADLWADEIESMGLDGIRCRMHYQGDYNYLSAPLMGKHSVYTMLRAVSVALILGISWDWIFFALKNTSMQVRIVAVQTINGARLIDDTYNASPDSMQAALNLLNDLNGRKVAVLGDMLELGQYEEESHQKVGLRASEVADELVFIGQRSAIMRDAAISNNFRPEKVHWFAKPAQATEYLKANLQPGDFVLVKASHGMHLEQIVTELEEVG